MSNHSKKRQLIRKLVLFFLVLIAVSLLFFLIFYLTDVFYFDDGLHFNEELFSAYKDTSYIYFVFLFVQVLITVVLCFVPGTTACMYALAISLFGANYKSFLICYAGVIISSVLMDLVGRFGGEKLVEKILGKEDLNSALNLIRRKSYTYLPFMYLLPVFPDDALCFSAGVLKVNFIYHLLAIILCRGLGCFTIIFGVSIIPKERFFPVTSDNLYEWFVLLGVLIAYLMALFKLSKFIDKKVAKHFAKKSKKSISEKDILTEDLKEE